MPPWTRLRSDQSIEKDLRRRTILDPSPPQDGDPAPDQDLHAQAQSLRPATSPRRTRRIRDSIVSLSAVNEPPSTLDRPSTVIDRPDVQDDSIAKHPRFSLLRFRHASDSQLAKTSREHANAPPPIPALAPPSIITTAPTQDNFELKKRKSTFNLPRKRKSSLPTKNAQKTLHGHGNPQKAPGASRVTFDEPSLQRPGLPANAPPPYGDESCSSLALPTSRMSVSSRSDESSGDHGLFATTTTTTHTVSTTTTFFRLPRRKKGKAPLFPLPAKVNSAATSANGTPRLSTGDQPSQSPTPRYFPFSSGRSDLSGSPARSGQNSPSHAERTSLSGPLRSGSRTSSRSAQSTSAPSRPLNLEQRGRSSTISSVRRAVDEESFAVPALPHSTRTSTSTAGRPSFAGLFNLSRLRQSSEPFFPRSGPGVGIPGTPGSVESKQHSFNLPREPSVVIPERQEGDTPAKYLARLEEVINRGALIPLLSKNEDDFNKSVMRSYMRRFKFFEDPLDMAVRKILMHVELPKETQQIDRTLQSFADRYHECNPGIFVSPDDAYFVAFSILILHTDVFNKNNKHKMQKPDYVKNAKEQGGVAPEILECFYDNVAYTPFIHVEDDLDLTGERTVAQKSSRKGALKSSNSPSVRKGSSGPVDPYTLILDGKLHVLRPALDDIIDLEDPFSYLGTAASINYSELYRTFFRTGIIQILSSRSRPEAFMKQATIFNPAEAQVGIVDMKVTKVGLLWRKDPKKKKARSPWQEWGAILTASQLYFFRNTSWVKNLMHQYDSHQKSGRSGVPAIFKPPLEQFKPDFLLSTEDVVALTDSQYKKHKHAFVFTRQNVFQEIFLAENESDMNDWLAKLNYAAAFRTAGVRMRGVSGGSHEPRKSRDMRRPESRSSSQSVQKQKNEVAIQRGRLDEELTKQVMVARRQLMSQKIDEAKERIASLERQIDGYLRTARHLAVLAPIQSKTREEVVGAAMRLTLVLRWTRIEVWRVKCHRDILFLDLEEDIKASSKKASTKEQDQKNEKLSQSTKGSQTRSPFGRLGSKSGAATGRSSSRSRPSNQPTGAKLFSMDDIFRSPSKTKPHLHKSKGSWELPPLGFERGRSVSSAREPRTAAPEEEAIETLEADKDDKEWLDGIGESPKIAEVSDKTETVDDQLVLEASVLSPEARPTEKRLDETEGDEEKPKSPDPDDKEGLSKVRHSLQRKLQNAHVPTHHRSKRARDSASTVAFSEDGSLANESEGLARGAGSFTVHGKKASVVKFGSEWQSMSQEEKLKSRRSVHTDGDDAQSAATQSNRDSIDGLQSKRSLSPRPRTSISGSVSTVQSLGFHTPIEALDVDRSTEDHPSIEATSPVEAHEKSGEMSEIEA